MTTITCRSTHQLSARSSFEWRARFRSCAYRDGHLGFTGPFGRLASWRRWLIRAWAFRYYPLRLRRVPNTVSLPRKLRFFASYNSRRFSLPPSPHVRDPTRFYPFQVSPRVSVIKQLQRVYKSTDEVRKVQRSDRRERSKLFELPPNSCPKTPSSKEECIDSRPATRNHWRVIRAARATSG